MADKAESDSGRQDGCCGMGSASLVGAVRCAVRGLRVSRRPEAVRGVRHGALRRPARGRQDRGNAEAPYFIHIVRANRADDLLGPGLGVSRVGQHEKQTVAG